MIAGILRGVLLRFASEYLSNIDISKLSLWSGHVSLQNVNLNSSAITNSLNLPYLRLESGKIALLELSLPWTSLSTKKVQIVLRQVDIELALTDNLINLNKPPAVSESEETFLSKILANITVIVQDLTVKIRMSEEAEYIACMVVKELQVTTTNPQWQEEFMNPFTQLPNGIGLKINRLIEVEGLSFRVISGKREEYISEVIVSHKFEQEKCGGCPLCFGFKNSSYYSLFNVKNLALKVFWLSGMEQTTSIGKAGFIEFVNISNSSDIFIQIMSNVNIKCNLVHDQMLIRDLYTAQEKFETPEIRPIEVHEASSWLSWGKSMLVTPLSCSPSLSQSRIRNKIISKESKLSYSLPSFILKLRIHNFQHLKTFKYVFSGENASFESEVNSSESSENTIIRIYDNKSNGSIRNFTLSCYEKQDCSIFSISLITFTRLNNTLDFKLENIASKSIKRGQKVSVDGLTLNKITGNLTLTDPVHIKFQTHPVSLDMKLEDLNQFNQALFELQTFVYRIQNPVVKSGSAQLPEIFYKKSQKNDESYIEELKSHAGELMGKLEQKTQECEQLRKRLMEVAGNTGIAGILNINTEDILCISSKARINESEVSLVLTRDLVYVMTKEGRIINKNLTKDLARLEEKGSNELSIYLSSGKYIRSSMDNRTEFVNAIKELFVVS